ncbi:hypothetical protein BH20CHL7_BH20CHL7_07580 [soil metagenome]
MFTRCRFDSRAKARSDSRFRALGQGLVEFSLVLPIFLVLLFGIIDIGRVIWANDVLANAVREGARYAIVHGGSDATVNPVGPGLSRQPVIDVVKAFAVAGGENLVVTLCYGKECSGGTDTALTNARGTPVTVTARSDVRMLTGSLLGFAPFNVSASSTMLVNN